MVGLVTASRVNGSSDSTAKPYLLNGAERYDLSLIKRVEEYVGRPEIPHDIQMATTMMRMYRMKPAIANPSLAAKGLVKSLTALPCNDFAVLLSAMGTGSLQQHPQIKCLLPFYTVLVSCNFTNFWEMMASETAAKEIIASIPDFESGIRKYISSAIAKTYSTISVSILADSLDLRAGALDDFVKVVGWKMEGEVVHTKTL